MRTYDRPASMALLLALAGCDSSLPTGGPDESVVPQQGQETDCKTESFAKTSDIDALPGGVWYGFLFDCARHNKYEGLTALVSEDGRFRIIGETGHLLRGTLQTDGDTFRGNGSDFAPAGVEYYSGPTTDLFIEGSVRERKSFDGRWGTEWGHFGYFSFEYLEDTYNRSTTLEDLAGVWPVYYGESIEGSWTVEPDGRFNGQSQDGCLQSGEFSLVDERYSIVSVEVAITGCSLSGSYSGLANRVKLNDWWEWAIDVSVDDGKKVFGILLLR